MTVLRNSSWVQNQIMILTSAVGNVISWTSIFVFQRMDNFYYRFDS